MSIHFFIQSWCAVAHISHGICFRDSKGNHNTCMIMAKVMESSWNLELITESAVAVGYDIGCQIDDWVIRSSVELAEDVENVT